ncbi:MAG: efflux RND transporter periplasmic adaptor subunit [Cypionkella sp.]
MKLALVTLPLALVGVGILAFIVARNPPPERNALAERATAVRVIVAKSQAVAPLLTGYGVVNPARTFEAIAEVGGTAEYVNPSLDQGAIMPAGEVLLRLSPADFNLAIAQARANIRASQARLEELTVSEENLKAALALENDTLALKTAELDRAESLLAGGAASQAARDAAQAAYLAQRQKTLAIESSLALLPTQRAAQVEQIAVHQASLDAATLNLARTELILPFAARVASVSVEVGQFVRVGQVIAQFDGIEAAEVQAQVSVADLLGLLQATRPEAAALAADPSAMTEVIRGLGLSVNVELRLGQNVIEWPAAVERISDTIDQKTGTIGVIVRVETAYSGARPGIRPPLTKGMFVAVMLSAPPVTGFLVPRSALRDGRLMLADADDRLQFVPIKPAMLQGEFALVDTGLEQGVRVVVSAPSPAMPGMLLEVTEDSALTARLQGAGQVE